MPALRGFTKHTKRAASYSHRAQSRQKTVDLTLLRIVPTMVPGVMPLKKAPPVAVARVLACGS